jgi:hypothetical protein
VALNALSEDEALFYQQAAELLRAYNEQVLPIPEITILGRIALGRSKERTLFFPAPVDEAIWMQKRKRCSIAWRRRSGLKKSSSA